MRRQCNRDRKPVPNFAALFMNGQKYLQPALVGFDFQARLFQRRKLGLLFGLPFQFTQTFLRVALLPSFGGLHGSDCSLNTHQRIMAR